MKEYRVTFGQKYDREPHPFFNDAHPDGWVSIWAEGEEQAYEAAFTCLGLNWAFLHPAEAVSLRMYPRGELAAVVIE